MQRRFPVVVRGESKHLERQDRKNARHQVEQHAAEQREPESECETQSFGLGSCRGEFEGRRRSDRGARRRGHCALDSDVDCRRADIAAESVRRSEHTGKISERTAQRRRHWQHQHVAVAFACERLRRRRLDAVDRVGEKAHLTWIAAGRGRDELQRNGVSASFCICLPAGKRPGEGCALRRDGLAPTRIGLRRACNRQRQREIGAFGNTCFLAHEPIGAGGERHVASREEIGRGRQRDEMQHFVFVPVVEKRSRGEQARRGPLDGSGRHTRGQLPFKGGR